MQHNVARVLGFIEPPDVRGPESVSCTCGETKHFKFNTIGQMVEKCSGCGTSKLYRGPKMLTRADKESEYGLTMNGDVRRVAKAKKLGRKG